MYLRVKEIKNFIQGLILKASNFRSLDLLMDRE